MYLNELPRTVERTFQYPITAADICDRIGDEAIEAPGVNGAEPIRDVIRRAGVETFRSPDELLTAIRGNLSDEYVGRKFYDDRGANPEGPDDEDGSIPPAESF